MLKEKSFSYSASSSLVHANKQKSFKNINFSFFKRNCQIFFLKVFKIKNKEKPIFRTMKNKWFFNISFSVQSNNFFGASLNKNGFQLTYAKQNEKTFEK